MKNTPGNNTTAAEIISGGPEMVLPSVRLLPGGRKRSHDWNRAVPEARK